MRIFVRGTVSTIVALSLTLPIVGCGDDDDDGGQGARRLRILVTNDDGVASEGIDELVEALRADADNDVVVCAPDGNRSATGDQTGPSDRCGDLTVSSATTASGYESTAINGCPADAVNYAFAELYAPGELPDVVLSGINQGQNVSEAVATQASGTVGAAKTAARQGVPALALSQGLAPAGVELDYPAAADAALEWLAERRADLLAGVYPIGVDSINVPSCEAGAIRGTLADLDLAQSTDGALSFQDCTSTLEDPSTDVEALNNGFIAQTEIPFE